MLKGFLLAGEAIAKLRVTGLYRHFAPTWTKYVEEHLGMSDRRMHSSLRPPRSSLSLPEEFSGSRLRRRPPRGPGPVPPTDRPAILHEADERAEGKPVRANVLRQIAFEHGYGTKPKTPPKTQKPPKPEPTPEPPAPDV